jgi:hypothetical protein
MLLVVAALADRPAHACIITGTCFQPQCRDACLAKGSPGGACVVNDCISRCVCASIS